MVEKHPALVALDGNREAWGSVATPPDRKHYPHTFLWDGAFVAIVRARYGDSDQAAAEIREILSGQKPDGMIPNMKFGPGRNWDPERRLTFLDRNSSSDYTQPPVLAQAAHEVYFSYERKGDERKGKEFLQYSYEPLKKYYDYWAHTRMDSGSNLVAIIHPHETGRDSDPTFDFSKKFRMSNPQKTVTRRINTALDYAGSLHFGRKMKRVGWEPDRARDIFWVKDVMVNAIYAKNLLSMAEIAKTAGYQDDVEEFIFRSQQVEHGIRTEMWNPRTKTYHAVGKDGSKLPEITVSNLFPLILQSVPKDQIEATLKLLESEDWFHAAYPIPSVPVSSEKYDPSFTEARLWRGPTWINTNWFIVEGLLAQRERFKDDPELAQRLNAKALHIASKSAELVRTQGYREFYHPETGKGMRVKDFAWSTLAHLMEDRIPEMEAFVAL